MELIAAIELARKHVSELKRHARNPRTHPAPGSPLWEILKKSLQHAYFEPLVWNRRNGCLISGHLRLPVLIDLGFTLVDVSVVDVDEPTHLAMMVAANRHAGQWEEDMLALLAKDIDAAGIDAALAMYDHKSLLALVDCPPVADGLDEAGELLSKADLLQEKWKVQLGDLYQIGGHRLLCGDCASKDNWSLLLEGRHAQMVWTDPPYNIDYDSVQEHRNAAKRLAGGTTHGVPQAMLNDDVTATEYESLLLSWFTAAFHHVQPGGPIYIAHADSWRVENEVAAKKAGFKIAQNLIWVKNGFTLGRQDYQWQHEPVLYGWKPGAAHHWQGGFDKPGVIDERPDLKKMSKPELIAFINEMWNRDNGTVQRFSRPAAEGLHPTVKPASLVAGHIWNSSRRGDTVLELFGGSGTTLAAAQQTDRRCVATELEPRYASVILERMTGLGLTIEKVHESN